MTRYLELKKLRPTLEDALANIHAQFEERIKLEADNNALIRLAQMPILDLNSHILILFNL